MTTVLRLRPSLTRHAQTIRRRRRHFSTYYDSQSGVHVPIHNENDIQCFLQFPLDRLPMKFYQQQFDDDDIKEELSDIQKQQVSGLVIQEAPKFPRDIKNIETLGHISPLPIVAHAMSAENVLCDYQAPNIRETLASMSSSKVSTLGILQLLDNDEPLQIASKVVSLLDEFPQAGRYILVSTSVDNDVLALCEELCYLDVPGPTIKSRLIVNVHNDDEDLVDECLVMGINKILVGQVEQVESLVQVAAELQGKRIVGPTL